MCDPRSPATEAHRRTARVLDIPASRFGWWCRSTRSARGIGLLAAGFADRFDRKRFLLFFYAGFVVGTLACALAPTYETCSRPG